MSSRKKQQASIYLEPAQAQRLKALSRRTRVPQAAYLREGVDAVLERHERELKRKDQEAESGRVQEGR